jgi:multicomponent Na+:H+ antiporter subunit B
MIERSESPIVSVVGRMVVPLIQLFALYVLFHGHYGPGGGFQGGAMLAASIMLLRLTVGGSSSELQFKKVWGTPVGSMGTFIFSGIGLIALGYGGQYLDHAYLPFGMEEAKVRSLGILLIEIGVAVALVGTLVAIFDDLVEGHEND